MMKRNRMLQILGLALILMLHSACSTEQSVADPNAHANAKVEPELGLAHSTRNANAASKAQQEPTLPTTISAAVKSVAPRGYRTEENTKRDRYRHPLETLDFFGLEPGMTVVEITPGAGWYTEIIAPLLATNGHYIGAFPPVGENASQNETTAKVIAWLKRHSEFNGHETVVDFRPPDQLELAAAGSADMIVTFRNVHNWIQSGTQDSVFTAFYKALKPGGILGVEDHRADPKNPRDPKAEHGYVLEKDVIAMAEKAGFTFVSTSEINANKKDTKDYPDGVWTLPPSLRLKEKEREKYLAIGESDRMTLKFIKPNK